MPAITASLRINPSSYDIENMRDENGLITRDSVEQWLTCHTGDFQSITDFYADIETPEKNYVFGWSTEENEIAYIDTISEYDSTFEENAH